MIFPGHRIVSRAMVQGILSPFHQIQPVIDFDNHARRVPPAEELIFQNSSLHLPQGSYLVQFNETVVTPLDAMGQIFVRSSLFRSGVLVHAGLVDSGYHGSLGAVLQVLNQHGLTLHQNARLAQLVFHQLQEVVGVAQS